MLSILLWLPVLGVLVISILPTQNRPHLYRNIALLVGSIILSWTVAIGLKFDPNQAGMQFSESFPWLEAIGINYSLGIDGLSLSLLGLNSLLTLIALYVSPQDIERPRFYYTLMLILNWGVSGAFLAQDVLLFFLFYEIEIIPLYFLIAVWGGQRREYAATKFLLYTALSGACLFAAFLAAFWVTGGHSFDYELLRSQTQNLAASTQLLLLIALLIGFGIKIPFFPLHTWLPDAHVEASTPVSILLAGVLLKLGTYGLLRFGVGFFLNAWTAIAPWLAIWAAISALYGASCAIAQQDMKKVVAYSSIAHMAFILLSAAATTGLSIVASIAQMVSHGLISALLFLLVGLIGKKTGSRDVSYLRGLLNPERGFPLVGTLLILGVMASAGTPGMIGFISEFLVFRGSFPVFPLQTLLCIVSTGLTAVYFLLMVNRVFFGRLPDYLANLPSLKWSEQVPGIVLALLIVALGLQPIWLTRWSEPEVGFLLIGQTAPEMAVAVPAVVSAMGTPDIGVSNTVTPFPPKDYRGMQLR